MFRERRTVMVGSIEESGYLLIPYNNIHKKNNEAEIVPYTSVTCHTYNFKAGYQYDPKNAYCITDDLRSCFTYAKEHNLEIVRLQTLDGRNIWKDSMEKLEIKLENEKIKHAKKEENV